MNCTMNILSKLIGKKSNNFYKRILAMNKTCIALILLMAGCAVPQVASAQTSPAKVEVPNWALPGSATHKQIPPPLDFHRPARTNNTAIGIFEGQSDVGAALVPGSSSYNPTTKQYTINSAGYNIWYTRDEFRYLWKKLSGDISLAADINFPDTAGYDDRKAVVIIRQSLDDDSKEAMVALHGGGLMHLAWRPGRNQSIKEVRVQEKGARRIGIEKRGDAFAIFVSMNGEPMHQLGDPVKLHLDAPFYVGIGFCSHLPDKVDTAVLSNVVLDSAAGKVR
jgi:hypothetical protein